jgi:hypothetical protein
MMTSMEKEEALLSTTVSLDLQQNGRANGDDDDDDEDEEESIVIKENGVHLVKNSPKMNGTKTVPKQQQQSPVGNNEQHHHLGHTNCTGILSSSTLDPGDVSGSFRSPSPAAGPPPPCLKCQKVEAESQAMVKQLKSQYETEISRVREIIYLMYGDGFSGRKKIIKREFDF